ncbi:MAG: hypothetical protein NTY15_12660 [Planctomycetota bacterium]|nr:hypothetical protein [Planctomycetota bacterium]
MIPILISDTGRWLDRFSEVLDRWESTLEQVQESYLLGDYSQIASLSQVGENIHSEIQSCKDEREQLLVGAKSLGYFAHSLKELSIQLDSQWPALWSHRVTNLEYQLNRIQQLSMSLWVTAFQSKSFVSELLLILATGNMEQATYSPNESHSHEGGFLINEAA